MRDRHRLLLPLVVLTWAISWPAIRLGVASIPPLWYACYRYAIAAPCLLLLAVLRRQLVIPSRADWPLVIISGGLQMGVYSALVAYALTSLPPGRASILAFSTPIWVVPLAAWRLAERMPGRGWLGVTLGIAGAGLIAAPSLSAGTRAQLLGCAALLLAAMAWAVSIVYVRSHAFRASPLALAPWQSLIAVALLLPCAMLLEGVPPRVGLTGALSLGYVGPVATAFAYWAIVEAGSHFRASTVSMALLATPPLGLAISVGTMHERLDRSLIGGVLLIALGIMLSLGRVRASSRDVMLATRPTSW
jgi:drug/metabolite transporter (DMT)-like permease